MDFIPTWAWFVGGLGFLIVELLTPTFFFGIVGVGALLASFVDLLVPGDVSSFVVFVLGSGAAAYLARRFEIYSSSGDEIKTGPDRLIGKQGIVQERIDSAQDTGIVQVEGEKWRAKARYEGNIEKGATVVVDKIEGTTLLVWETQEKLAEEV
ncbi:MAG: NfeD family protein [Candidatus Bipolaricaulota bacterium]